MKKIALWTMAAVVAAVTALPLAAAVLADAQQPADEPAVERAKVRSVGEAREGGEGGDRVRVLVVTGEGDPEIRHFEVTGDAALGGGPGVHLLRGGPGAFSVGAFAGRGFLGVALVDLTPELRAHFGAGEGSGGVLVGRVDAGSPAERAGLRVGDVLTHVDGEIVASSFDAVRHVRPLAAGDVVGIEVVRDGRVESLTATIEERELHQLEAGTLLRRLGEEGEGIAWEVDPGELSKRMESVTEFFASPEWKAQVEELASTSETLEERLRGLEEEMRELERRLREDGGTEP